MNKKRNLIPVLLFLSLLSMPIFSSCDKDTNCYLNVFVRDEATHAPIQNANITVYQNGGSLYAEGVTGSDGIYSTHFVAPAILNIKAELPLEVGMRRGETSIRLKEGETITATVTMTEEVFY